MSKQRSMRNQQGELKESGGDSRTRTQMQGEIDLLREQLELLKQELRCECQIAEIHHQELRETKHKLRTLEHELRVKSSQMLGLDAAKEFAKSLVSSNQTIGKSSAKLLSAIYNVPVEPVEFGHGDKSHLKIRFLKKSNRLIPQVVKPRQFSDLKAHFHKIETRFGEIETRCSEIEAGLNKIKVLRTTSLP